MIPLKIPTADFNLESAWTVTTVGANQLAITGGPYEGSRTVTFEYEIPDDVTVVSSKIHSIWGGKSGPIGGYASGYPKVNDVRVTSANDWMVDVDIDPNATYIDVTFALKVNGNANTQGSRSSSVDVSDVYLLIEYIPNYTPPELVNYTDPNPVARETFVKAVHMTELHTNVNRVRSAYGLDEFAFTDIVSGETGLGGWNNHVLEIRNALDVIGASHEDWIELGDNCPRVDILLQLRNVVAVVAAG